MRLRKMCNGSKDPAVVKQKLHELYDEYGDYQIIADICFVTKRTVYDWCVYHDVKTKPYHSPKTKERKKGAYTDWEFIMDKLGYSRMGYMIRRLRKLGYKEASKVSGVSAGTLYKQYKKYGVI